MAVDGSNIGNLRPNSRFHSKCLKFRLCVGRILKRWINVLKIDEELTLKRNRIPVSIAIRGNMQIERFF